MRIIESTSFLAFIYCINYNKLYVIIMLSLVYRELFLQSGMTESDAMSLLHKVSGCHDTAGSQQLVNLLDKVPLSVAR